MPTELHKAIIDGKSDEVWTQIVLLPQLRRLEDGEADGLGAEKQGTMFS